MKRIFLAVSGVFLSIVFNAFSVEKSELSPAAQALIPDVSLVTVHLKAGGKVEGSLSSETDEKVSLKVKKGETITMTKTILKADIKQIEKPDVGVLFAEKLKEFKLDPKNSLSEQEYKKAIALFDEFLQKFKDHDDSPAVRKLKNDFEGELKSVLKGLAKVDGEWLTPVCASVKRFNMYADQMGVLKQRPDFESNKKVKDFYEGLVEQRRSVARNLPKMMQDHLPKLIDDKQFDDAVSEVTAFQQFWIAQVIKSEGKLEDVIKGMDFEYITRMEKKIVEAYAAAKLGNDKTTKSIDKNMVYVPGGYFLMGKESSDPKDDNFPLHIVFVNPFMIDKCEVSNEEYRKFADHVKKTGDSSMEHPQAPLMKKHEAEGWKSPALAGDRQPVVGVDWFDAYAFAKWSEKRLPTEAEWEKAAKGMEQRKYPWGEKSGMDGAINFTPAREFIAQEIDRQKPRPPEPQPSMGCSCVKEKPQEEPPKTTLPAQTWAVDRLLPDLAEREIAAERFEWNKQNERVTDVSPYGALHMAGNAAEWVNDVYSNDYYSVSPIHDPVGPSLGQGSVHVYKGGSYLSTKPDELVTWLRGHPATDSKTQAGCTPAGQPFIGFRCAKSLDIVAVKPVEKEGASAVAVEKKPGSFDDLMNDLDTDKKKKEAPQEEQKPPEAPVEKAVVQPKPESVVPQVPVVQKPTQGLLRPADKKKDGKVKKLGE